MCVTFHRLFFISILLNVLLCPRKHFFRDPYNRLYLLCWRICTNCVCCVYRKCEWTRAMVMMENVFGIMNSLNNHSSQPSAGEKNCHIFYYQTFPFVCCYTYWERKNERIHDIGEKLFVCVFLFVFAFWIFHDRILFRLFSWVSHFTFFLWLLKSIVFERTTKRKPLNVRQCNENINHKFIQHIDLYKWTKYRERKEMKRIFIRTGIQSVYGSMGRLLPAQIYNIHKHIYFISHPKSIIVSFAMWLAHFESFYRINGCCRYILLLFLCVKANGWRSTILGYFASFFIFLIYVNDAKENYRLENFSNWTTSHPHVCFIAPIYRLARVLFRDCCRFHFQFALLRRS